MESDSDSDGSHISATPPRLLNPSSTAPAPAPAPPPSSRHGLLSSNKSRIKVRPASSSRSKPISKHQTSSHKSEVPDPNAVKPDPNPPEDPFPIISPTLPFQIRSRIYDQSRVDSLDILPAGFFSKSTSFSKIRRSSLNFDPVEDDPCPSLASNSEHKVEIGGSDWVPEELKDEEAGSYGNLEKVVKRHSNLIGSNVPMPPVKLRKCGGEGNFVRLNMKRNKRKFLNKGRRGNSTSSSGRRSYRRYKKKLRTEGGVEMESVCEEDGSVMDTIVQQRERQEGKKAKFDRELIEEAILAARNEASDENLVKLLSLTHGYDSFRKGQLEAIKMVLAGKSAMLVLPTGAGKSLCYQLPAMVLPGITLVVSPLVALMIDQLKQLPPMIQGGLFCSSQVILAFFINI